MKWWSNHRWQGISLITLLVATITLFCSSPVSAFGSNHKKVLLKDVQTLTLHKDKMTAGRRASPVPQLTCVGGNACGDYEPDIVQCTNAGFDGSDVQWKCQADLPDNLRFGELSVYCEGFGYPDDPYVLKGSCGLEYKLYYTNIHSNQERSWGPQTDFRQWAAKAKRQSWIETIYLWTWVSIVGFILYSFIRNCFQQTNNGGRGDAPPPYRASGSDGFGGGGGGPGGGGGGGGGPGGGWGSGWGNNNSYQDKRTDGSSSEGFRPGFWSGIGLGGLATYLATNGNRQRDQGYRRTMYDSGPAWGTTYSQPSTSYGSYSGGLGASSSSPSSSSSSRPTRSATGYGGTRRREGN
ncbi:Store-operated calcium entry-associated regulatory factor [Gamsiella multidivaricata]|nr:Store-operated calcium entry-associated regulatory factor [Gamsiella multidivaricata]